MWNRGPGNRTLGLSEHRFPQVSRLYSPSRPRLSWYCRTQRSCSPMCCSRLWHEISVRSDARWQNPHSVTPLRMSYPPSRKRFRLNTWWTSVPGAPQCTQVSLSLVRHALRNASLGFTIVFHLLGVKTDSFYQLFVVLITHGDIIIDIVRVFNYIVTSSVATDSNRRLL